MVSVGKRERERMNRKMDRLLIEAGIQLGRWTNRKIEGKEDSQTNRHKGS
jgi:hypothetical protein